MPYLRAIEKRRSSCRSDKSPTCHLGSPAGALRHQRPDVTVALLGTLLAHRSRPCSHDVFCHLPFSRACRCLRHGAETLWKEITVRVYDSTGAGAAERRAALGDRSVDRVGRFGRGDLANLQRAGFVGRRVASAQPSLREAARRGELALRIVRSRAADGQSRELPLGEAMIDAQDRSRSARDDLHRPRRLDGRADGRRPRALLGRAIAHELGHLLMATSAHGAHGLMRPVWSQSEIRRRQIDDWIFRPREIAAIKRECGHYFCKPLDDALPRRVRAGARCLSGSMLRTSRDKPAGDFRPVAGAGEESSGHSIAAPTNGSMSRPIASVRWPFPACL